MRSSAVVILALIVLVNGYGEPDPNGRPVYQERANFNLINTVRIAPTTYKSIYMNGYSPSPASILGSTYPAVAPLYWEPRLGAAAYTHSAEMANKNYFEHASFDGSDTWTRIGTFYSCNGGKGENIAAGGASPVDTSNQWLCDKPWDANYCPLDGAKDANGYAQDGHRSNIMGNFQSAGVGFAYNASSTWGYYWTQDFGGPCAGQTSPIYSGSHYISGSTIKFAAVFASSSALTSSTVVINGVSQTLTLEAGSASQGSFAYSTTTMSGCRSYYFTFVAGGTTIRYPTTGCLTTTTEGSCTSQFDTTCGSASTAAGSGSTSATAAAAASTTGLAATAAPVSTTGRAATAAPTVAPTAAPTSGPQFLYQNGGLVNAWTTYVNPVNKLVVAASFAGKTCLSASIASGSEFLMFQHASEANVWSIVSFYGAANVTAPTKVYFNGGYYTTLSFTTQWQLFNVSMSTLGNPNPIGGNKQLIFAPTIGATLYSTDIQLRN